MLKEIIKYLMRYPLFPIIGIPIILLGIILGIITKKFYYWMIPMGYVITFMPFLFN